MQESRAMRHCFDWLDSRLGYRTFFSRWRDRKLPNGPSWLSACASCLFGLLVIQIITGLLMMASYSPSTATAWASVHFIEQSAAGRFIRGIHHFASHAMIVLLVVHVARVLIIAGFRKPRELVWVTGLLLIPLIIIWTVTGNPLSGSQTGLAQIEVEGHIMGAVPVVGPLLQRLLIGGDEVGNLTMTHLYFLHVGLLPLVVGGLCAVHLQQIYRHGLSNGEGERNSASGEAPLLPYWPHQSVRNWTVLAGVMGLISAWVWTAGAPLDAPADAALPNVPRPEWYFRWIFELRRFFTGDSEFLVTVVLPGVILGFFMLVPLFDHWLSRRLSGLLRVTVVLGGLGGWSWLTYTSLARDWRDPEYLAARQQLRELAQRARFLADRQHVTAAGAAALLRGDARTQGPLLFARHCAACHDHVDARGIGIAAENPSAPNLFGFGSSDWIERMLDPRRITSPQVFGNTKFRKGEMASKIRSLFRDAEAEGTADELKIQLKEIARALGAESRTTSPGDGNAPELSEIQRGRALIAEVGCVECHKFHDDGDLGAAPDLTGYASREWLTAMISDPTHERFYPEDRNDRMPGFASDAKHPEMNLLSPEELRLLVDWLRGEWLEPEHQQPGTSSPPAAAQIAAGK
jgi:ubiquinol-cytochrome c reductase cytochrome b subunit